MSTPLVSEERFSPLYIAPTIHLAICIVASIGYVVPQLQFLGILWSILTIADFPVSAVTVPLAYYNGFLAFLWTVVGGTAWWYLLSKGVAFLSKKFSK